MPRYIINKGKDGYKGMKTQGNIDLDSRPQVVMPDGSIATVRTISIGTTQGEVLIPTIGPNGEDWTPEQAIEHYQQTGENFGVFDNPDDATAYAQDLHLEQEKQYVNKKRPADILYGDM